MCRSSLASISARSTAGVQPGAAGTTHRALMPQPELYVCLCRDAAVEGRMSQREGVPIAARAASMNPSRRARKSRWASSKRPRASLSPWEIEYRARLVFIAACLTCSAASATVGEPSRTMTLTQRLSGSNALRNDIAEDVDQPACSPRRLRRPPGRRTPRPAHGDDGARLVTPRHVSGYR
jgi:hypothetical protein